MRCPVLWGQGCLPCADVEVHGPGGGRRGGGFLSKREAVRARQTSAGAQSHGTKAARHTKPRTKTVLPRDVSGGKATRCATRRGRCPRPRHSRTPSPGKSTDLGQLYPRPLPPQSHKRLPLNAVRPQSSPAAHTRSSRLHTDPHDPCPCGAAGSAFAPPKNKNAAVPNTYTSGKAPADRDLLRDAGQPAMVHQRKTTR